MKWLSWSIRPSPISFAHRWPYFFLYELTEAIRRMPFSHGVGDAVGSHDCRAVIVAKPENGRTNHAIFATPLADALAEQAPGLEPGDFDFFSGFCHFSIPFDRAMASILRPIGYKPRGNWIQNSEVPPKQAGQICCKSLPSQHCAI